MSVKITGIEFKRFYNDKTFWPDDVYVDDEGVTVNGVDYRDLEMDEVDDSAIIIISCGVVYNIPGIDDEKAPSLESYFKKWRKKQTTKILIVECDIAKADAIIAAIKAAGGKVKE